WLCLCDCGNEKSVRADSLVSGRILSCGCYHKEAVSQRTRTHGLSNTLEYHIWENMIQRCTNPNHLAFGYYGGRGITVCDRWRNDFTAFINDMGPRPSNCYSVDRIDVNKGYEPGNCRWATRETQMRNTRIYCNNTSGVKGVAWDKTGRRWRAY